MAGFQTIISGRFWVITEEGQPELVRGLPGKRALGLQGVAATNEGAREALGLRDRVKVVTELKPKMTWYQATRHSFVSRHLSGGASLDEVSAAVGHSSPVVTKRFYDHYVRRSFSPKLRAGLGLGGKQSGGRVVPLKRAAR